MYQVIEQTPEEKLAMYMKLPKAKIIEMLLENQRIVKQLTTPLKTYTMHTDKTTTVEQDAKLWWDGLEEKIQRQFAHKYFSSVLEFLKYDEIISIYKAEHPSLIEGNEVGDKENFMRIIRDQFFNAGFENIGDNLHCYCSGGEYAKTIFKAENETFKEALTKVSERLDQLIFYTPDDHAIKLNLVDMKKWIKEAGIETDK